MKKIFEYPAIRVLATVVVVLSWALALISTLAFFCYGAPMALSGTDDLSIFYSLGGMFIGGFIGFWLMPVSYLGP